MTAYLSAAIVEMCLTRGIIAASSIEAGMTAIDTTVNVHMSAAIPVVIMATPITITAIATISAVNTIAMATMTVIITPGQSEELAVLFAPINSNARKILTNY